MFLKGKFEMYFNWILTSSSSSKSFVLQVVFREDPFWDSLEAVYYLLPPHVPDEFVNKVTCEYLQFVVKLISN